MKRIFTAGSVSPALLFLVFGTAAVAYAQKEQEKEAKPEKAPQQQKQQAKPAQQKPERAQQEQKPQAKPAQQKPERAQHEQKPQAKPAQQKPERAQHEQKPQAKPAQQKPERAQHEQKPQAKPAQQKPERAQHEQKQQAKPAQQKPERAQHEQKQQAKPAQRQQARSNRRRNGANKWPVAGSSSADGYTRAADGREHSWQHERATQWQAQHRTWAERGGYGGYYIPDATFALSFGDQHWFRITSEPTIIGGYPRFQHDGFWFMMVDPWPESWSQDWYATDDVYVGYNNGYYLYNRRDPGDAIAISIVL